MMDFRDSVFTIQQQGLLCFAYYGGQQTLVNKILTSKAEGILVELIASLTELELRKHFRMSQFDFISKNTWSQFVEEIHEISDSNHADPSLLLGTVMELMDFLEWQGDFSVRKFLVLMLTNEKELSHLKISVLNTPYKELANFQQIRFSEARLKAKSKSKIL